MEGVGSLVTERLCVCPSGCACGLPGGVVGTCCCSCCASDGELSVDTPSVLVQALAQQSPPSEAEIESLARHDGMSIEEATRSLEVQHQAGDISSELRAVLGDAFAGVWYGPEGGYVLDWHC